MRTTLAVAFSLTSTIPGLKAVAHDLPGFPDIVCIDFVNEGNKELPRAMQSIMLVPYDTKAPNLGADRTLYTVPRDFTEIKLTLSLGAINDRDFIVGQMTISTDDGDLAHTHVACELP